MRYFPTGPNLEAMSPADRHAYYLEQLSHPPRFSNNDEAIARENARYQNEIAPWQEMRNLYGRDGLSEFGNQYRARTLQDPKIQSILSVLGDDSDLILNDARSYVRSGRTDYSPEAIQKWYDTEVHHGGGGFGAGITSGLSDMAQTVSDGVSHAGHVIATDPVAQLAVNAALASAGIPPGSAAALMATNAVAQGMSPEDAARQAAISAATGATASGVSSTISDYAALTNAPVSTGITNAAAQALGGAAASGTRAALTGGNIENALSTGLTPTGLATNAAAGAAGNYAGQAISSGLVDTGLNNQGINALANAGASAASAGTSAAARGATGSTLDTIMRTAATNSGINSLATGTGNYVGSSVAGTAPPEQSGPPRPTQTAGIDSGVVSDAGATNTLENTQWNTNTPEINAGVDQLVTAFGGNQQGANMADDNYDPSLGWSDSDREDDTVDTHTDTDVAMENIDTGPGIWDSITSRFTDPKTGSIDWTKLARMTAVGGIGAVALRDLVNPSAAPKVGYSGPAAGVPAANPNTGLNFNRRALAAADSGIRSIDPTHAVGSGYNPADFARVPVVHAATGGQIPGYAGGGGIHSAAPYYLGGSTDGMADKVPAVIDGHKPARLAHGEFVIPADVVSHLGNGNSDAGAKKLHEMMAHIRKARTGNPKQGREIDPNKFLPGMKHAAGGIAALATGGEVPGYAPGGTVQPTAPVSNEQGLASWVGAPVTNMVNQASGVANDMMTSPSSYVYQGARTAGPSALQTQGFNAASSLSVDPNLTSAASRAGSIADQARGMSYDPTKFSNQYTATGPYQATTFQGDQFTGDQVQQYMNPYLEQSLNPQKRDAMRDAEIQRMTNAGRLVGSGAFGGGRQAIMESEGDRNLLNRIGDITAQGYNTAYNTAMGQFNQSQQQALANKQATEASKQFGANLDVTNAANTANYGQQAANASEASKQYGAKYGLDALQTALSGSQTQGNLGTQIGSENRANIGTQLSAGNMQRGIENEGLQAAMAKFNEEAALPAKALGLQHGVLSGLPITATNYQAPTQTGLQQVAGTVGGADQLYKLLTGFGGSTPTAT